VAKTLKARGMAWARRDILKAASRAFARRGFHGTTMEEVAREAGCSTSSLYTYFRGKEDLYRSLLVAVHDEFEETRRESILPSLPFRDRLAWLLGRQFEVVERNREFFVMAAQNPPTAAPDGELAELARRNYLRWIDAMTDFLAQGQTEGAVRASAEPRDLAYYATGAIRSTVARWAAGDLDGCLRDHVPRLVEFLVAGGAPREAAP
jgi:AcrR family transcriptional regulator